MQSSQAWIKGTSLVTHESLIPSAKEPLVLLLGATKSVKENFDAEHLGDAIFRLLSFLADAEIPVTIITFNSRLTLLHPKDQSKFELVNCELRDGKVHETMQGSLSTVETVLNQSINQKNVAWIVEQFGAKVAAQTEQRSWITPALVLAGRVLEVVCGRTDHGRVLLLSDGHENYGGGLQRSLPSALRTATQSIGRCPSAQVVCLALSDCANVKWLAAIALMFDGCLCVARSEQDIGRELETCMLFLSRSPRAILMDINSTNEGYQPIP